jgi:tRNA dimethylallyltransferase
MTTPITRDCWFLTGPTASGKTAVGIELAKILGAEIISLDSMALYRRLDIGTAKPTAAEQAAVPHHLIDVIEPEDEFSQAQYVASAEACVTELRQRDRETLFVGGTPLYLKSLLRGIFAGPPADWELRHRWEAAAREHGPEWLHAQVERIDSASARKLHPRDKRRLIRVLEVYEKTGQPISELQQQFDRARAAEACRVFMLEWPREELSARIDARVDAMFAAGLVEEVERLLDEQRQLSRTARQAVGYREVLEHLAGERGLAETIALVKTHTRQFAKRQETWFRSLSEVRRVPMKADFDPIEVAKIIAAMP